MLESTEQSNENASFKAAVLIFLFSILAICLSAEIHSKLNITHAHLPNCGLIMLIWLMCFLMCKQLIMCWLSFSNTAHPCLVYGDCTLVIVGWRVGRMGTSGSEMKLGHLLSKSQQHSVCQ